MKTIHKLNQNLMSGSFVLEAWSICRIEPHYDSFIEIWYLTGDNAPTRTFDVVGTGHPIPDGTTWVATAGRSDGGFVWHLVEVHGA